MDGVSDAAFVAVGGGGVDVAVADPERFFDGGGRLVGWRLEDAEADGGHLDTVVEGEGVGHSIDFVRVLVVLRRVHVYCSRPVPRRPWISMDEAAVSMADITPKARAQYSSAIPHIESELGAIPLCRLDRDDVARWINMLADGGKLSRRRVQICRNVLRAAMADAVGGGLVARCGSTRAWSLSTAAPCSARRRTRGRGDSSRCRPRRFVR